MEEVPILTIPEETTESGPFIRQKVKDSISTFNVEALRQTMINSCTLKTNSRKSCTSSKIIIKNKVPVQSASKTPIRMNLNIDFDYNPQKLPKTKTAHKQTRSYLYSLPSS
jgi:hypothetical protein